MFSESASKICRAILEAIQDEATCLTGKKVFTNAEPVLSEILLSQTQ